MNCRALGFKPKPSTQNWVYFDFCAYLRCNDCRALGLKTYTLNPHLGFKPKSWTLNLLILVRTSGVMTAGLYPYRPSRIGSGLKNKSLKSLYTVTFYRTHTRALNPHELPHEQPQALGLCWSGAMTLRIWICGLLSRYVPYMSYLFTGNYYLHSAAVVWTPLHTLVPYMLVICRERSSIIGHIRSRSPSTWRIYLGTHIWTHIDTYRNTSRGSRGQEGSSLVELSWTELN